MVKVLPWSVSLAHIRLHLRVTRSLVELVKGFEGLRRRAARLGDGGWTIGYGHARTAREGVVIGPEDAEALLYYDLSIVAERVEAWTFTPLNQNQFEALTAFAFNIGLENFRTSEVLRHVNAGRPLDAAAALERWSLADIGGDTQVVDALVRRRAAEKALFLTPPDGFRPSPTPVMRPKEGVERPADRRGDGGRVAPGPAPSPPNPGDANSKAEGRIEPPPASSAPAKPALRAVGSDVVDSNGEEEAAARGAIVAPERRSAFSAPFIAGPLEAVNDGPFGVAPAGHASPLTEAGAPVSGSGEDPLTAAAPPPAPKARDALGRGVVVGMSAPSPELIRLRQGSRVADGHGLAPASLHANGARRRTTAFAIMGLLGAFLFAAGAVSLMVGQADGVNLAVGLVGVLFMSVCGGYFLLRNMRVRDGSASR